MNDVSCFRLCVSLLLDSITKERVENDDRRKQVICIASEKIGKRLTRREKQKVGPRNRQRHLG